MPVKGAKSGNARTNGAEKAELPSDFPSELLGEFTKFTDINLENLGRIVGLVARQGGYIGFSVTDDRDSCKLAVRCGKLAIEKRCGSLVQFETLLAYVFRKLTE